ncbi:putative leader peptide [Kitasatospora sp. NPDC089509]
MHRVCMPDMDQSRALTRRRHVDLQRVSGSLCRR